MTEITRGSAATVCNEVCSINGHNFVLWAQTTGTTILCTKCGLTPEQIRDKDIK